ncbi:hypothetical protein J4476_02495 [Candidatus Woesearchaeota archaeon]|nr:MAG: hypothetical protein QT09_C0011G0041 [archaeon GW2011_AR18]MBS3161539.1 hypothetical protein [Candidatus Woesearchaeota archaeon]
MKSKKADVWVSAILYFGLGIIIISILLAAGLPAINKLRDKNVVLQTKEVFQVLDKNIRDVVRGGPGGQRVVKVDIKKGDFKIDDDDEQITWEYITKIALSEPGKTESEATAVSEGNLKIKTWISGDGYKVRLWISYSDNPQDAKNIINLLPSITTITGITDLAIRNDGAENKKIKVSISEVK